MTRDELIGFLVSNYEADQELVWHTAAQGDVEFYVDAPITDEEWAAYCYDVYQGGDLFGDLAKVVANDFDSFRKFLEKKKNKED